jgi:hypothetical protein
LLGRGQLRQWWWVAVGQGCEVLCYSSRRWQQYLIGIGWGCDRWWWRCCLITERGGGSRLLRAEKALGKVGILK